MEMCLESAFEEHKNIIRSVIWKNRALLSALRLEDDDVSQQLAITMLSAIRKFDPNRSASMRAHIRCSLQFEILNIKRRHKPHGVTGLQSNRLSFLPLDNENTYSLLTTDDISTLDFADLMDNLTEMEAEALNLKLCGHQVKRNAHKNALEGVRRKYDLLCA